MADRFSAMERRSVLDRLVIGVVVILQVLPVLAVSLNGIAVEWSGSVLPEGLTMRWIDQMVADPRFFESIEHSLVISIATLALSAVVAIPAVLVAHCYLPVLDRWLAALVVLPYAVPSIVLAVGLLRLYAGNYGVVLTGTPWILIFGYVPLGASFYYVPMKSNLRGLPVTEILEAGRVAGIGDATILRRVILPSVAPALVVGFVMNFALAISEFVYANLLVGGFYPTLQILMNVLDSGSGHLLSVLIAAYFIIVWAATSILIAVTSRRRGVA
jgi:putative spermidine/putrescine transport system permease protein